MQMLKLKLKAKKAEGRTVVLKPGKDAGGRWEDVEGTAGVKLDVRNQSCLRAQ